MTVHDVGNLLAVNCFLPVCKPDW